MNFLIDFVIGAVITISGEQVISPAKSPAPAIAASAPSTSASAITASAPSPTVSQMKDKV